jgi:hypothetical protein
MRCAACGDPFKKRDLIGRNGDRYFHLGNSPGALLAGYVDDKGVMQNLFPEGRSMGSAILADGKGRWADVSVFPPKVREF